MSHILIDSFGRVDLNNWQEKGAKCLAMIMCGVMVTAVGNSSLIAEQSSGEAEFRENCSECHIDGGNIIKSTKTLSEKDRSANGIKTSDDIINIMRNPGEGMTRFDNKTLSDSAARNIADYIISTFK